MSDENQTTLDDVPENQQALVQQEVGQQALAQLSVDDILHRLSQVRDLMERAMKKDVDYGVIPGTGKKPTLLKPGAELLGALFQMRPEYEVTWTPVHGKPEHIAVFVKCKLFSIRTGAVIGEGVGQCSTMESKYRWRQASRSCPKCGKEAIIKGKQEYGGGWVCFKKKGGCGAKYPDTDQRITNQAVGRVENEDVADQHNTVVKMAAKRAKIDATITATATSSLFTQDLDDLPPPPEPPPMDNGNEPPSKPAASKPEGITQPQLMKIKATGIPLAKSAGQEPKEWFQGLYNELELVGVHSAKDLTKEEASRVIEKLEEIRGES